MSFLQQFISQLEENEDMSNLKAKAAELQGELQAGEPRTSRSGQLRSVIDNFEHKKAAARGLKAKVNDLGEQLKAAEVQLDEITTEVHALEEKRAKLCESLAGEPDSDTDEDAYPEGDTEYPTPEGSLTGKGGKGKGKRKFKGKVKSWSLISGLNEEDLEEMLEVSRAELKRRRTGDRENTQSEEEDVEFSQSSQDSGL